MSRRRGHPSARRLALLAGGELNWWERFRLNRHLGGCRECRIELESLREARLALTDMAQQMPPQLHWDRMAAEMKANIRLGLEAGEIVAPAGARPTPIDDDLQPEGYGSFFRPVVALASVAVVLYGATWMLSSRTQKPSAPAGVMVGTTGEGIELKNGATAMTLYHQGGKPVAVEVSTGASVQATSLRAQYVDEDTGEVTIHHVYAE